MANCRTFVEPFSRNIRNYFILLKPFLDNVKLNSNVHEAVYGLDTTTRFICNSTR